MVAVRWWKAWPERFDTGSGKAWKVFTLLRHRHDLERQYGPNEGRAQERQWPWLIVHHARVTRITFFCALHIAHSPICR